MAIAGGGGGGGGSPPTIQWTFPNTVANDQNPGLFTFVAPVATAFIGFDIKVNAAPLGQDIIVDWRLNGVVIPAFRTTLVAGNDYVFLPVPVAMAPGDTLKPDIIQTGGIQPGQTAAIRARGV